jgi:tetratricopeptide (TPR) repeat protein
MIAGFLNSEAEMLYDYGSDRGSNVHLLALIEVRRKLLAIASAGEERGLAQNNLGTALWRLGERESGTARLEEAAAAYREALKERTRGRVPLDWAATQNNLGIALASLGWRESGTAKLEEAVAAFREALKELTREAAPAQHASVQEKLAACLDLLEQRRGT